jgi:hypothetical protein
MIFFKLSSPKSNVGILVNYTVLKKGNILKIKVIF